MYPSFPILRSLGVVLVACGLIVTTSACGQPSQRESAATDLQQRRDILPEGTPSGFFQATAVGRPLEGNERPQISNVGIADLDDDGLLDILVCDAGTNHVSWIRQLPGEVYHEEVVADILAPAHVEATDIDLDGDLDLLVASLGELFPSNQRIGSVIVLENDGDEGFSRRVVAEGLPRVADVRAGDLDGDGDQDLAVAAFGYDQGQTLWLEQVGAWTFEPHVLQGLSGAVNAVVTDIDADGAADIVNLVSQEWEEVWAFDGSRDLEAQLLWGFTNSDFGSSWITMADLDQDGDPDIVYSNGDAFDYAPSNSRPWHGVQWLENTGDRRFEIHRIADLSGASSPQVADLDRDGDLDVVVVSAYNRWTDDSARSLVWLENDGSMRFAMHQIARSPTHLITLAVGDLNGDGYADLVTGGMHISSPYDRMSRVTLWRHRGATSAR